eukprot:scaffold253064_cov14-Tisochrysis_lutea.AAC.1
MSALTPEQLLQATPHQQSCAWVTPTSRRKQHPSIQHRFNIQKCQPTMSAFKKFLPSDNTTTESASEKQHPCPQR